MAHLDLTRAGHSDEIYKDVLVYTWFLRSCGFHPLPFPHDFSSTPSPYLITMRSTAALFAVSTLFSSALGATYNVKDSFVGESFLSGFTHQAIADPTHGRV